MVDTNTASVIVAGSRSIQDVLTAAGQQRIVFNAIDNSPFDPSEIVSGTARGVDQLGEEYAEEHGLDIERFPANWEEHGRQAGPIRNTEMAEYADALVAIHVNDSRGTADMIDTATEILGRDAVDRTPVETTDARTSSNSAFSSATQGSASTADSTPTSQQ